METMPPRPVGTKVRVTNPIRWHDLFIPTGAVGQIVHMYASGEAIKVKFDDEKYGSFDCWASEIAVVKS